MTAKARGTPATWPRAEECCTNSLAGLCLSALIGCWRVRPAVEVSGTCNGDSRRTRVLLCVRSGSRPGGPRRQLARPRCLRSPPARRGSSVGKWPVNCRHEPEVGRYRDRRLIGSHLCGTEITRHGLGFAISRMRRQPRAIPEISARIQRPGDQAPGHFATRSRASQGRHQNRSKTK